MFLRKMIAGVYTVSDTAQLTTEPYCNSKFSAIVKTALFDIRWPYNQFQHAL